MDTFISVAAGLVHITEVDRQRDGGPQYCNDYVEGGQSTALERGPLDPGWGVPGERSNASLRLRVKAIAPSGQSSAHLRQRIKLELLTSP